MNADQLKGKWTQFKGELIRLCFTLARRINIPISFYRRGDR